jgi:type VII secretion protein EssB
MNAEPIRFNYLTSTLEPAGRKQLTFPHPSLVPCEMTIQTRDNFILSFDQTNLDPFYNVQHMKKHEKFRALANVALLEPLLNSYSFHLHPDNLRLDVNLIPLVVERWVKSDQIIFIEEYKALIAAILVPKYTYEDYLKGGKDLMISNPLLLFLRDAQTVHEIRKYLMTEYETLLTERNSSYTDVRKSQMKFYKLMVPLCIVVTLLAVVVTIYYAAFENPRLKVFQTSYEKSLEGDFKGVQKALNGIEDINDMPKSVQYVLAESYLFESNSVEVLDLKTRKVMATELSLESDPRVYKYWIAMGRGNYDEAVDIAQRLTTTKLLWFALFQNRIATELDTMLTGEAKATKLEQIQNQLDKVSERMLEEAAAAVPAVAPAAEPAKEAKPSGGSSGK